MVELLAVVIGGPRSMEVSTDLVSRYKVNLPSLTVDELRDVRGIGRNAGLPLFSGPLQT
jgi:hypothetical protein